MTDQNIAEPYSTQTVSPQEENGASERIGINDEDAQKWIQEQRQILYDEAKGIKHFHTIGSDVLFEKQLEKRKYIVEGLLPEGLTLLSGDPKIGKSFFALSLSVSVAKGIPFLCFPTTRCDVLYFSFEDDEKRLQQRLYDISDDTFSGLKFSNDVLHLGDGFIESVESYLISNPETKLVVIDTLNYIRPEKQSTNMYKNDYDDMIQLHRLTQQYSIAILILHHNKKGDEEDALRAVSGSMGITGGVDNCIVIKRPKDGERVSLMSVVSRDMKSFKMKIMQGENGVWVAAEEKTVEEKKICIEVQAVFLFYHFSIMQKSSENDYNETLTISPTDLSNGLKECFSINVPPTMIKKKLTAEHEDLELLGLKFEYERKKTGRRLVFRRNENFRNPKYIHLYDDGTFFIEVFSDEDFKKLCGDSGDGVTAETDIENDSSSTVDENADGSSETCPVTASACGDG